MTRICVFCGSHLGSLPDYRDAARALGIALVRSGHGLVYGGGNVGLMGILADSVLATDGEVVGVIPESLVSRELAHAGATEMHVVPGMHQRKALMAELSHGFIAMPGGFGTFEELFEVITWWQLGFHQKPIAVLDTAGYFDPFLAMIDRAVQDGFIALEYREQILVERDPEALIEALSGRLATQEGS